MKNIMKLVLVVSLLALVVAAFAGCQIGGGQTTTPTPECQHSWKPATCLEAAYCRLCGEKIGEALGHDVQPLPAVAPTCTETGLTEGSHCARCKEVYTAQEEVPSLGGHTYEGTTCTACGDVLAHVVVYLSNAANWNEVYVYTWGDNGSEADWPGTKVEADENGVYSYTLITAYYNKVIFNNGAGAQTADLDIPADENVLFDNVTGAWRHLECTFVDATCEAPKTCSGCGYTIGEALGHDIVVDEAVAPTCDATGLTAGEHCTRCDHVVAQEEVPALGHDLVDVEAKANTCTEDGYTAHKDCSRCDYKEGYEVVAAAHAIKHTITLPTLTTAGRTTVSCEACDAFETITFGEVSAMGMGTYVLDASDEGLAGTVAGTYADGDVYVHGGVFEMHLSAKFKVDGSKKTFPDGNETYLETRLNYGGKTQFRENGAIFNGIVFTTTHTSTVKIYWVQGGDDHRQVALYNLAGDRIIVQSDNQDAAKNDPCYNEFTVPAGTYVLGNVTNTNYHFRVEVVVAHNLVDVEAKAPTCTEDGYSAHKACDCGYTEGKEVVEATGHADEDGNFKCDVCSAKVLPADGSTLTIEQALAIAKMQGHNTYTTQKYYVTGTVTNLYNTQYGNFYIKDENGTELCIYGLYLDGVRYDKMTNKPVEGDVVTVYGPLGAYNTTYQMKNADLEDHVAHEHAYESVVTEPGCLTSGYTTHTCSICRTSYVDSEVDALGHTTDNGECERCGLTIGGDAPVVGTLATFDFGSNGSAAHVDGNDYGTAKSFEAGTYTLSLTGMSKVYGPAYDAKGNSCIKLGTSSKTGSFTFTVPENVTEVVIYVAQYKANTTKITVNGTAYTVTTSSNDGAYTAITIDTTTTKTVTFDTVSGGVRCMIDTIVFNGYAQ